MDSEYRIFRRPPLDSSEQEVRTYRVKLAEGLEALGVRHGDDFVVIAAKDLKVGQKELGPFSRDSETSRQAALDNYPRSGSQRRAVLIEIVNSGGMTRDELAARLHLPDSSVDGRVWDLKKGDFVREGERKRRTRSGSSAAVVEATPKGLAAAKQHGDWEGE